MLIHGFFINFKIFKAYCPRNVGGGIGISQILMAFMTGAIHVLQRLLQLEVKK